jgi:transcriptional regulator with GAF, ATPase, and Fis domain
MSDRAANIALRTSLTYGLVAALWIMLSDRLLVAAVADQTVADRLQTYKGWSFVTVTTILLYGMLRRQLWRWQREARERKQAEQALQRSADRLRVLADASQIFAQASGDYPELLSQIARTAAEVLGEGCLICLLSDDQQELRPVAFHDVDPHSSILLRDALGALPLRVEDQPLSARILHTGLPQLFPSVDITQLDIPVSPAYRRLIERVGIHSLLAVPLRVHSQLIGIMVLQRHYPDRPPFDMDDLTLAQDLADRAALAITTARLYNQFQQSNAGL